MKANILTDQPRIVFHDGYSIPQIGLGVFATPEDETAVIVGSAIDAGYRHIDTATMYNNEAGVGQGVRDSGIPREEIFVTTKLWSTDHGYDKAMAAFDNSEALLDLDYVDLYMIHWPSTQHGLFVETWRALIQLQEEGRIRSIGVSNFEEEHLEQLIGETGVTPVINQIECHPGFQQHAMHEVNARLGIVNQSWAPLGRGHMLNHPVLAGIAEKHSRSIAQIMIRWHVQGELIVIPKSSKPERIAENFDVFTFELDEDDLAAIVALDDPAGGRIGPDPYNTTW